MPSTRPRLLVVCSTFPAHADDGTPAFVLDLASEEAREFDVVVLAPRTPGAARSERIGAVEVRRFGYFPERWEDLAHGAILDNLRAKRSRLVQVPFLVAAEWLAVRRAVATFRPDVVHAHWLIPQGLVATLAAPRVPLVVTAHGADVYALQNGMATCIKRFVLRRSSAVTTVNSDMAGRLVTVGARADRTSVIPMGVDVAAALRTVDGTQRDERTVVVVGRLVEKKGITHLIEAMRRIDGVDWRLVVIGDGPLADVLRSQAEGLPVEFRGALGRTEVLREVAAAAVAVVPSVPAVSGDQEDLPVSLLEAAALGTPIVASDLPGIHEAVSADAGAVLVRAGDERALRAAVAALLLDPAARQALGERARRVAARLSLDVVGERYRGVLMRTAGRPDAHG